MNKTAPSTALALLKFNARVVDLEAVCFPLEELSNWTTNVDLTPGDFSDVAIAEGLTKALKMFPFPNGSQMRQNEGLQNHCILVVASNPYPNAGMVAESFPRVLVMELQ